MHLSLSTSTSHPRLQPRPPDRALQLLTQGETGHKATCRGFVSRASRALQGVTPFSAKEPFVCGSERFRPRPSLYRPIRHFLTSHGQERVPLITHV
uniref:Uncharacterized protein n=1 Tax=Knipowitschia caucasica TaxID=637954 RepID=A0AAV2KCT6_KNICA